MSYHDRKNQAELDQLDNYAAQNSLSSQLAPIIDEIMSSGQGVDAQEKGAQQSARLGLLCLCSYCARQCAVQFTPEQKQKMKEMQLDDLLSELSSWMDKAGLSLARVPVPKNYYNKMNPYWSVCKAHKFCFIDHPKKMEYKIIKKAV